jgi:hypothetical protein
MKIKSACNINIVLFSLLVTVVATFLGCLLLEMGWDGQNSRQDDLKMW